MISVRPKFVPKIGPQSLKTFEQWFDRREEDPPIFACLTPSSLENFFQHTFAKNFDYPLEVKKEEEERGIK